MNNNTASQLNTSSSPDQQTPLLQPGTHVDQEEHNKDWETGFCSCSSPCGTCCLGACCPCILYGRTQYRLEHNGSTEGYSFCNSNCTFYSCLMIVPPLQSGLPLSLQSFLGYAQRKKIRQQYGLRGGPCGDYLRHYCCPCCSLIQEEEEVIKKSKDTSGYQPSAGMYYSGNITTERGKESEKRMDGYSQLLDV